MNSIFNRVNRQVKVTEKFGSTVINTTETTYDAAGQPVSVTQNGRATTNVYDNMGRLTSATLPGSRTVNYAYATTGEMANVAGADTYTQAFTYNEFGNMATLTTYKGTSAPQTTSWTYNNRNFMTAKIYPDNKSTTYTYDYDGKMLTRAWARGITTTYTYDNAGRRTGIAYDDNLTPGIAFTYDFLNRVTAVTDGTGSHSFTYNADSTLASETIPHIVSGTLEYAYDNLGRRTGLQLKQNSSAVYNNSYAYDVQGRIATVGDGNNTAAYSRVPGTNLLSSTTIANSGVTKLSTSRTYDSYYRMTGISSSTGSVTKAYNYTYDDKDRRTQLNMPDGSRWVYGYDEQGQIVSGIKYDSTGKAIPGQSFGYTYDGIGNLTSEQRGVTAMNIAYTANNINQYISRTIPGLAPVVGEADPTVAVKAIRTDVRDPNYADTMIVPTRDGKYFSGIFRNIVNTNAPVNITYDVYATKNDTANNQQLINKQSGSYTVAKSPQSFAYDNDGNMLSNGSWTYTYNAENRPVTAVNASNTAKLEYAYDYDGRRVNKKIYAKSSGIWTLTQEIKFVYDGNNLIAEYAGSNTILRNHLWGVDLSGTMDGAGGTGGLLCVTDGTDTYYPAYDGNGNICAYIDNTGALVAEYDYSPFGKLAASGAKAADLPFQFSTQYYDKETGTSHFKYREYDLDIMRWTTQDPMGEDGGVNLYGFVKNNPIGNVDYLGMKNANSAESVYLTLLVGQYMGDISPFWWNILKTKLINKRNGDMISKKGTVCFNEKEASPKANREAIDAGYGFLLAHGNLFVQLEKSDTFKNPNGTKTQTSVFDKQITYSDDPANIEDKSINTFDMAKKRVPDVAKGFTIKKNLFLKVFMHDTGYTSLDKLIDKKPAIGYSKTLPVYACYAGVISKTSVVSNGITITSGSFSEDSVTFATIQKKIESDVEAQFDELFK